MSTPKGVNTPGGGSPCCTEFTTCSTSTPLRWIARRTPMCSVRQWMKKPWSSIPSFGPFQWRCMVVSVPSKSRGSSPSAHRLPVTGGGHPTGVPQAEVDSCALGRAFTLVFSAFSGPQPQFPCGNNSSGRELFASASGFPLLPKPHRAGQRRNSCNTCSNSTCRGRRPI